MDQLADLLAYVQNNSRICPRPIEWSEFYEKIGGGRADDESGNIHWNVPPPLILSQWGSSTESKRKCFIDQIKWSAEQGRLDIADTYLRSLSVRAWHHSDPTLPHY